MEECLTFCAGFQKIIQNGRQDGRQRYKSVPMGEHDFSMGIVCRKMKLTGFIQYTLTQNFREAEFLNMKYLFYTMPFSEFS